MNDKRNPSINRGDGETSESYRGRLSEYISKLEWQSEGHRLWYTHKNPYGCWICELLQVCRALEDISLDGPTDADAGIEDDYSYNYDEEDTDLNTT